MRLVRASGRRLDDFTLDGVAQAILGEGKTVSARGEAKLRKLERLRRDEPARFCGYCLRDAELRRYSQELWMEDRNGSLPQADLSGKIPPHLLHECERHGIVQSFAFEFAVAETTVQADVAFTSVTREEFEAAGVNEHRFDRFHQLLSEALTPVTGVHRKPGDVACAPVLPAADRTDEFVTLHRLQDDRSVKLLSQGCLGLREGWN
jgi:hypothetical protein